MWKSWKGLQVPISFTPHFYLWSNIHPFCRSIPLPLTAFQPYDENNDRGEIIVPFWGGDWWLNYMANSSHAPQAGNYPITSWIWSYTYAWRKGSRVNPTEIWAAAQTKELTKSYDESDNESEQQSWVTPPLKLPYTINSKENGIPNIDWSNSYNKGYLRATRCWQNSNWACSYTNCLENQMTLSDFISLH